MKTSKGRLIVYLADLTHMGISIATDYMPLNIGCIASYVLRKFGKEIEVKLFKYPEKLFSALREGECDVLGCSTYIWNNNLSEFACKVAKKHNPGVATVRGGWNFPLLDSQRESYMLKHDATDIFCINEGELAFSNVIERLLSVDKIDQWNREPLDGSVFINRKNGTYVKGVVLSRIKDLSQIPSPYATGLLDEFFDGNLIPIIETARGCPFTCSYCNSSSDYYSKVEFFPTNYVIDEINYIARKIQVSGITSLMFADTNLGMYQRDREIAVSLKKVQSEYGWPLSIQATTGKNRVDKIIEMLSILDNSLSICMSVQSMSQTTLRAINRDNISLGMYKDLSVKLSETGMSQQAELIVPLPEETFESFMEGIRKLVEMGSQKIIVHTLQINNGTIFKDPEHKEKYGYGVKFRLIPYDFGIYEGEKVFDYEEVGVSNNTLNFDDYRKIRKFSLIMELLANNDILVEMFKFLNEKGVTKFNFLKYILDNLGESNNEVKSVFDSFDADIVGELKTTEEGLVDFYSKDKNYAKTKSGEIGGNVIFRHKGMMLRNFTSQWIDYVFFCVKNLLQAKQSLPMLSLEIEEIKKFSLSKLNGLFASDNKDNDIVLFFEHDLFSWIGNGRRAKLEDFRLSDKKYRLRFYFDDKQKSERQDLFSRYGNEVSGIAKILARVPAIERLFRKIEVLK